MAQVFTSRIVGAKEIERALLQLPKSLQTSVSRQALRNAAIPVAGAIRSRAPIGDSDGPHLRDSIVVTTKLSRSQKAGRLKSGDIELFIGPSFRKAHIAMWLEFGTGPRIGKDGHASGQITARPFIRPAWDSQGPLVSKRFAREMRRQLPRVAKRLFRKAKKLGARL